MVLGQAARQCLALGLHQPATYNILFPKPHERASAVRTFWVVYVLDRRWSFGTSLPFALPENHIDPNLPKPVSLLEWARMSVILQTYPAG